MRTIVGDGAARRRTCAVGRACGAFLASSSLFVVPACAERAEGPADLTVDTLPGGAVVVTNAGAGHWTPSTAWHLEPVALIGSLDGDESATFGMISDVAIAADGRVFVLDLQAATLQTFHPDGRPAGRVGRRGEGPGELGTPYAMAFDELDRLWIADERNRRYAVFDREGAFVEARRSPIRGGLGRGRLRFSAGRLWDADRLTTRETHADGSVRLRSLGTAILGFPIDDALVPRDTIPLGPSSPPALIRALGAERLMAIPSFAPRQLYDVAPGGTAWTGTGDAYALYQVGTGGDTLRIVRRSEPPIPLSASQREQLDAWAEERRAEGFEGDASVLPVTYPFFGRITATEDGHLWVLRHGPAGQSRFDVFDPEGVFLGGIPTDFDPAFEGAHVQVTRDRVAGVLVDELGVPRVAVYRIVRPDA